MTRIVEGDPASPLNRWPLLIDSDSVRSVAVAWLFTEAGAWRFLPRLCGDVSLFYNAQFFVRICWPFGIFVHIRLGPTYLAQSSLGWKLNGRFTIGLLWLATLPAAGWWYFEHGWSAWLLASLVGLFAIRIQTDESAARGVSGPNYGQSPGYEFGTH